LIKKIGVLFLSGAICLATVGLALAMEYKEAPMLRTKVAAGELPPVEERLPEEPLVVVPVEEIGQYGGTARQVMMQKYSRGYSRQMFTENLTCFSPDYKKVLPNIAKGWEWSEDNKSVTFYLRKGMKWSDGAPFTADDFVFYWNDIMLNKELSPIPPSYFIIGGEPGKIEKIDDYTFKISFVEPYGMFLELLIAPGREAYACKHYLEQFHPKYTPMDEIKKVMEKEGFDIWIDLFGSKNSHFNNPGCPQIDAWIPQNTDDKPMQIFVRNSYYWKVDTEGNQLPYIDKWQRTFTSTTEATLLKTMAGEMDYGVKALGQDIEYWSMLMQYREQGDYRLTSRLPCGTNHGTIYFNFWHKDPAIRELYRNKQFRIALSTAIDREEVSVLLWKGIGIPSQAFPPEGMPWYEEEFCKSYTEYNPDKANEILDELGLKWDEKHEYRLLSNGKRLEFVLVNRGWPPDAPDIMDLLTSKYWKQIGLKIVPKIIEGGLWGSIREACDYDLACEAQNRGFVGMPPVIYPSVFPIYLDAWCQKWTLWFISDGKEGEEPPQDVKRLMELRNEILAEPSAEKRVELSKEALAIHAENLWTIGIVTEPSRIIFGLAKNNFRNVAEMMNDEHESEYIAQFFIKK